MASSPYPCISLTSTGMAIPPLPWVTSGSWSSSICVTANPVHWWDSNFRETFPAKAKTVLPSNAAFHPGALYTLGSSFFPSLCTWSYCPIKNKQPSLKHWTWSGGGGCVRRAGLRAFSSTSKPSTTLHMAVPCCLFSFGAANIFYDVLVWHIAKAWARANDGEPFFPTVSPDR